MAGDKDRIINDLEKWLATLNNSGVDSRYTAPGNIINLILIDEIRKLRKAIATR